MLNKRPLKQKLLKKQPKPLELLLRLRPQLNKPSKKELPQRRQLLLKPRDLESNLRRLLKRPLRKKLRQKPKE